MTVAFLAADEFPITKDDRGFAPGVIAYGVYVGGAGVVDYVTAGGTPGSRNCAAGDTIPIQIKTIKSSSTATLMTGYKI